MVNLQRPLVYTVHIALSGHERHVEPPKPPDRSCCSGEVHRACPRHIPWFCWNLADRAVFPLRQGLPTMGFVDDISREGVSAAIYTQEQAGSSSKRRAWCYRGSVSRWPRRRKRDSKPSMAFAMVGPKSGGKKEATYAPATGPRQRERGVETRAETHPDTPEATRVPLGVKNMATTYHVNLFIQVPDEGEPEAWQVDQALRDAAAEHLWQVVSLTVVPTENP